MCQQWKVAEYSRLGSIGRIPKPWRKKVFEWLYFFRRRFPAEIIQNSFSKCGFAENLDVDIDVVLDFIYEQSADKFELMVYDILLLVGKHYCTWIIAQ